MSSPGPSDPSRPTNYGRLHLVFGWWSLLLFLSVGIALEVFHAFKVGWYLDVGHEARRLMFTLGHAHGTLLSLVNIIFGLCVAQQGRTPASGTLLASRCLLAGVILLPGGFLLGGIYIFDGDPGLGVWLVPVGAILLLVGVLLTAIGVTRAAAEPDEDED